MELLTTTNSEEFPNKEELTPETLAGLKVLVIDDEEDHRVFISRLLRRYGASSQSVSSVCEAFKVLENYEPDVIISDIGMPDQDGFDFIRIFRKEHENSPGKRIPVIALSAYTEKHWQVKSIIEGFQLHLAKPIQHRRLVANVARLAH